jgi:hypothetical protein
MTYLVKRRSSLVVELEVPDEVRFTNDEVRL